MTQNERELLLKDLCARLPYGVKYECSDTKNIWKLNAILTKRQDGGVFLDIYNPLDLCKPYLFPLSSMTDEQRDELKKYTCPDGTGYFKEDCLCCPINHFGEQIPFIFMSKIIEWLDRNHFDYRGLIPMGLANDATGLNIY